MLFDPVVEVDPMLPDVVEMVFLSTTLFTTASRCPPAGRSSALTCPSACSVSVSVGTSTPDSLASASIFS